MIIGGTEKVTEVVEFTHSNSTPSYGELPTEREYAVGAMHGNAPIVCGGSAVSVEMIQTWKDNALS